MFNLPLVFIRIPTPQEWTWFLVVLAISAVVAWLAKLLFEKALHRLTHRTHTYLDNAIISALDRPLVIAIVVIGVYRASFMLPFSQTMHIIIGRGFPTALALLGIYAATALLEELIKWYRIELATKFESTLGHQLIELCRLAVLIVACLMAAIIILEMAGIAITPVKSWIAEHGGRISLVVTIAIMAIFAIDQIIPKIIARSVYKGTGEQEEEAKKRADTLGRVLITAAQAFVLFVAIFMLLSELGIDIAPVLAGVGVVGLAIGFGAQNLVRDILAGLFVIMENQYRVGDVVKVADVSGVVEDINLRRTVLRDMDAVVHFVPNGEIKVASNYTKQWSRVNLNISVGYGEDLDKAISVLNRIGKQLAEDPAWAPLILKPPQVLRVENLGESGIEIKIIGDTKPIRQWDVTGELRKRIKKAFDEEGIEIPWPHTKVYFGNTPFTEEHPDKAGK